MQRLDRLIEGKNPLIIAHRGAWNGQIRENTLEAFERAINLGADAVEFDVRRTADGVLVIHHDEAILGADKSISQVSYQENLGLAKAAGYHLPTLHEVVELCHDRMAMDVEIKESGYEKEVVQQVLQQFDPSNVIFKSFHDEVVKSIKQINPSLNAGLLVGLGGKQSIGTRMSELFPAKRLAACQADFVAPSWKLLRFNFLQRMRKRNVPVLVWTVDDSQLAIKLRDNKVAGIITNKTEEMIGLFKK